MGASNEAPPTKALRERTAAAVTVTGGLPKAPATTSGSANRMMTGGGRRGRDWRRNRQRRTTPGPWSRNPSACVADRELLGSMEESMLPADVEGDV